MDNYQLLEPIGKGSFSKVFKVQRKGDQRIFVAKEMEYGKMSDKEKQQLVTEVNILRELKHPNLIKYYDRVIDKQKQKIYVIMEYCEGGDLAQILKKLKREKEQLPENKIWSIFTQIVQALNEIHKRKEGKILHRDIKPANIFLDSQYNVKLGDFGLARMLSEESEFAHTSVGTPYYMSPELINENKYNEKSDIWACGCLLYEMCTLSPPFIAQNYLALAMKIKQGVYDKIPEHFTSEMNRVIQWCLSKDQQERPNVDDLLNIPRISLRLKERRLKENIHLLNLREEDLVRKQQLLLELEKELKNQEEKNGFNKENQINNSSQPYIISMYDELTQRKTTKNPLNFIK